MPKISVGRDEEDQEEYGMKGTGMIGRHLVGENEEAHMANKVHLDLATPHVMGVFGKRGTGKCLQPDEKILTENGLTQIKTIFDEARENGDLKIDQDEEQLYKFEGPKVQSVTEGFQTSENEAIAAYRKKVDEELVKIKTKSGREIKVTKEHPLFTVEGWKDSEKLSEGEKIGVPRKTTLKTDNKILSIPESFKSAKYSALNQRESQLLEKDGKKLIEVQDSSGSYRNMVSNAESKQLVEIKQGEISVTEKGQKQLQKRKKDRIYRLGKAKPIKIPENVTKELAEFLSYMIAEGHEQKVTESNYRVIFTNNNEKFLSRFEQLGEKLFDLEFSKMDQSSIYTNSFALQKLLEENGYNAAANSFSKNIPNFILSSNKEVISQFLQTYYDCEGNVTDQQIELTTASKEIADAVNYMLLRFGIIGRTTEKQKYASNTEEQKVRKYYQVTVSGGKQLRKFKQRVDFSLDRKSEKLHKILKNSNTNVDTIPTAETIKECRKSMGADRTQIAKHKQSLKSYEDNKYQPSREKLQEIANNLEEHLRELKDLKNNVEENPEIEDIRDLINKSGILWKEINHELGYSRSDKRFLTYKKYKSEPSKLAEPILDLFNKKHELQKAERSLSKLKSLASSDIYWDEIAEIRKINYEGWVYDLTVEGNHSFTAGYGGILCHNSYSLGTVAEEIVASEISQNLSTIIIDPMGIYWSMKRPNDKMSGELESWGRKPEGMDIQVYIPEGKAEEFDEKGMPYDETFTMNPADFTAQDWMMAFNIEANNPQGILLQRAISKLQERMENYDIDTIIKALSKFDFDEDTVKGLENRFMNAQKWGLFGDESSIEEFMQRGELSVIDMSAFGEMSSGWSVRSLVVGLLAKEILKKRMKARRMEELDEMEGINENEMPIVWMLIDEAHQFLPADGKTPATRPLLRWVKIGREPGVSLALCTQQPAKLHPNALSQCDILLSHRLTAKQDINALGEIMQSYMRHDLKHYIDALPDRPGTGLILDDNSERVYPVQMRPRKSWHAGGTPDAFEE